MPLSFRSSCFATKNRERHCDCKFTRLAFAFHSHFVASHVFRIFIVLYRILLELQEIMVEAYQPIPLCQHFYVRVSLTSSEARCSKRKTSLVVAFNINYLYQGATNRFKCVEIVQQINIYLHHYPSKVFRAEDRLKDIPRSLPAWKMLILSVSFSDYFFHFHPLFHPKACFSLSPYVALFTDPSLYFFL